MSSVFAAHTPDIDYGRVVFIIMLLIGGFFQWLTTWWKKKRETAARLAQPPPETGELSAHGRAWEQQVGIKTPEISAPPAAVSNPFENFLKTLRDLSSQEILPVPVVNELPPERPKVPVAQKSKSGPPSVSKSVTAPMVDESKRAPHPVWPRIAALGGLKNAMVLREVLGPPKALQSAEVDLI